jgi:hypothetical protein
MKIKIEIEIDDCLIGSDWGYMGRIKRAINNHLKTLERDHVNGMDFSFRSGCGAGPSADHKSAGMYGISSTVEKSNKGGKK